MVSAALALTLAQRNNSTVRIVDLSGDIPSALGIAEPSGEGVTNWLQQPQRAPIQSLQIPVTARVSLLPRGTGSLMHHDLTAEKHLVFDRFYRATATRALPGSGLGLAIVKQFADDHAAVVAITDTPGGATVALTFAN